MRMPKQWILNMPFFLLVISCGISSGTLMLLSFLLHIAICKYYHIALTGPLWESRHFRYTLLFIAIAFGCAFITIPFNQGRPEVLFRYLSRLAPLLLVVFMARVDRDIFRVTWYGLIFSCTWLLMQVLWSPNWQWNRLFGPFSSPNTLAGLLIVLLPAVLFGLVRYRKSLSRYALFSVIFLCAAGVIVLICTGSRNGYGVFGVSFLLLLYFIYRHRDRAVVKFMGGMVLGSCLVAACFAPGLISQRMGRNIQQDARTYLIQSGLQMAWESPVIGIGVGNWGKVYKERFEAGNPFHEKNIQSPHNIYLHIMDESGIIGLSGFFLLVFYQLRTCYKGLRNIYRCDKVAFPWLAGMGITILSVFLFGFLDYDFFSRHMMQLYWFFWGMCLYAIELSEKEYRLNE